MKNNKLHIATKIIMAALGISLIIVLFTPIWRIELNAPQYPEGLCLTIHANDIKGNVDIINGLNHYIGMKTLHKSDFPEFTILPYCIMFFVVLFLLVAIVNRKKLFFAAFFLFVFFGIVAMADFWKWEYNYGHNLDPHAAIIVPGMAYQPPLIGFKQLLNFGAYSIPDIGGWIFLGCGMMLIVCLIIELKLVTKFNKPKPKPVPILAIFLLLLLGSCTSEPEPIKIGTDTCTFCKMTISDARFGAEIVTHTGKVFKFDDILCLKQYFAKLSDKKKDDFLFYLIDFCGRHQLIQANKCFLLKSDDLKCPMDGHLAAFDNIDSMKNLLQTYKGEQVNWAL